MLEKRNHCVLNSVMLGSVCKYSDNMMWLEVGTCFRHYCACSTEGTFPQDFLGFHFWITRKFLINISSFFNKFLCICASASYWYHKVGYEEMTASLSLQITQYSMVGYVSLLNYCAYSTEETFLRNVYIDQLINAIVIIVFLFYSFVFIL